MWPWPHRGLVISASAWDRSKCDGPYDCFAIGLEASDSGTISHHLIPLLFLKLPMSSQSCWCWHTWPTRKEAQMESNSTRWDRRRSCTSISFSVWATYSTLGHPEQKPIITHVGQWDTVNSPTSEQGTRWLHDSIIYKDSRTPSFPHGNRSGREQVKSAWWTEDESNILTPNTPLSCPYFRPTCD